MEKARKREIAQLIAKNASNEFFSGFVSGYNAAKCTESTKTKKADKKPA